MKKTLAKICCATLLLGGVCASAPAYYAPGNLYAQAMGHVFTDAQSPTFALRNTTGSSTPYKVVDFFGKTVTEGVWSGTGELQLTNPGCGYYELTIGMDGQTETLSFAVVTDPAKRDLSHSHGFFGIDSAVSWIGRTPPDRNRDSFEATAELTRLLGATANRDRLSWGDVNQSMKTGDYKQYDDCARYMSERNIDVLGMFHDTVPALRGRTKSLPDELFGLFSFCNQLGKDFNGTVNTWEFWNEQNATWFNFDATWEMATAHKVAYLAFKRANPDLQVSTGGLTEWIGSAPEYFSVLLDNDLYEYFDIFAFHLYATLDSYEHFISEINSAYAAHNLAPKCLWITESGTHMEGKAIAEPIFEQGKSYAFDVTQAAFNSKEHSPAQEAVWAEFIVKSAVHMQMLGVERNFPFVLLPYNEQGGGKAWGFFRWDYSVKPVYAAMANMIVQLDDAQIDGKLDWGKNIYAYSYTKANQQNCIVAWNGAGALDDLHNAFTYPADQVTAYGKFLGETSVKVNAADGKNCEVVDLMGNRATIAADANGVCGITLSKYPVYIYGAQEQAIVKQPLPVAAKHPAEVRELNKNIVISLITLDRSKIFNERILLVTRGDQFIVEVYNFGEAPSTGKIFSGNALQLDMNDEEITIPAGGKVAFPMTFVGSDTAVDATSLVITGSFDGKAISQLSAPILNQDLMKQQYDVVAIPGDAVSPSSSGKIENRSTADKTRFEIDFNGVSDAWCYPVLEIDPAKHPGNLYALSFEMRCEQSEGEGYLYQFVIPSSGNGKDRRVEISAPTKEWQTYFIQIEKNIPAEAGLDFSDIRRIAIGFNPKAKKQTMELRNIQLMYRK